MLPYAKVADAMQSDQTRLTGLGIKESNPSIIFTNSEEARCDAKLIIPNGNGKRRLQERSHESTNTNN
jgi:hypothetical protein